MSYSGYIVVVDEERRADQLAERGITQNSFSDALSAPDWGMRDVEVCFVSFGGESLDRAYLATRGVKVATAKYRVTFSQAVDLGGLPVTQVEKDIDARLRSHFTRSHTGYGGRVPPRTWEALLRSVKARRPQAAAGLDQLLRQRENARRVFTGRGAETLALEKDAIGVALDIFDPQSTLRNETLANWVPAAEAQPPFMEGIGGVRLTEEQMLAHDANIFGGITGTTVAYGRQFRLGRRVLDVIYANRTRLEETLGVDLIYWNHAFKAYTFVQYKRMQSPAGARETRGPVFRPNSDTGFAGELKRMKNFRAACPDEWGSDETWDAFRLNGDGFFVKLCPIEAIAAASAELVKGMYLPREYLESLLASPVTDGPRGGKALTYETVQRHLSNTEFTRLVHDGWVGTRGVSTSQITRIVRDSFDAGKAVIMARSSGEADRP